MSEVTRYELEDIMVPDETGDWVMHSDHLAATAELRRELDELKRQLWGAERRVVNLETERDEIRSELNKLRSASA